MTSAGPPRYESVDTRWRADHPLPAPNPGGDKEQRGHVLVVAGSREMPGAAVLAAVAALHAGAGKLTIVTAQSVATLVGMAVPEARVVGAEEPPGGGLAHAAIERLIDADPKAFDAVLVGCGMQAPTECAPMFQGIVGRLPEVPLLLDALAMTACIESAAQRPATLITPHAGELASLIGWTKERIVAEPHAAAAFAAAKYPLCVLLKGPTSVFATPHGIDWQHRSCRPGLGTSGSGDVLAGTIVGLLARGADPGIGAGWGVSIHDRCGERLEQRIGVIGYLARDIAAEIAFAANDLGAAQAHERQDQTEQRRAGSTPWSP